jgi:hypothetical protein
VVGVGVTGLGAGLGVTGAAVLGWGAAAWDASGTGVGVGVGVGVAVATVVSGAGVLIAEVVAVGLALWTTLRVDVRCLAAVLWAFFLAEASTAVLAGAEAELAVFECEVLVPPQPAAARAIRGVTNSARFKRNLPLWFALSPSA